MKAHVGAKRVLMFGWEFPPVISGGLGVACYGIVQGLLKLHVDVKLVLPFTQKKGLAENKRLQYICGLDRHNGQQGNDQGEIDIELVDSLLRPYATPESYLFNRKNTAASLYGTNLWLEVQRYAHQAGAIAMHTPHDVIHAHDWLTILAGIEAKKISGKPLIFHVHALEKDRCPQNPSPSTQVIERLGLEKADLIITVSQYTKKCIIQEYQIPAKKIKVVYNGHPEMRKNCIHRVKQPSESFKVIFLGRVTEQKGAYYFIKAAEKILSIRQDVDFILAGEGDQLPYIIDTCARLDISSHVHFTGFLGRDEVSKFYELSDVYVMPSVSEPFGIVCLEAIAHGVPVVISKQSGVSEVLTHSLKVDYWDIDLLAANIMALLDYPALGIEMLSHAKNELSALTWDKAAEKILRLYMYCLLT